MEDKILLLIQFGVELIRFWVGMTVIFGGTLRKKWIAVIAYGLFAVLLFAGNIDVLTLGVIMWVIVLVAVMFTVEKPAGRNWIWKLYCGFILVYQQELVCIIVNNLILYRWNAFTQFEIELINSVISLIIVILISVVYVRYKGNFENRRLAIYFRKSIIPMVVFIVSEIMFVIVFMNRLSNTSGDVRKQTIGIILSILSVVSIGMLFVIVSYVKNTNDQIEQMLVMEKQMKQLQMQYYESLLKKEEATRSYRHDMKAHFVCLSRLIREDDVQGVREYIRNMQNYIEDIQKYTFNTGIKMLDTLLNHYVERLDEDVTVNIKGKCRKEVVMSDTELCTIFSNLINNAVEAIQVCEQSNPFLLIEIDEGGKFVEVRIKNSMKPENLVYDEKGNLCTTKGDKKNHGLGMTNVKKVLSGHKSSLEFYTEKNQFCCKVVLPIRQNLTDN